MSLVASVAYLIYWLSGSLFLFVVADYTDTPTYRLVLFSERNLFVTAVDLVFDSRINARINKTIDKRYNCNPLDVLVIVALLS